MAKKRKLTATQKERRAVQAAIRRAEKMGIRFADKLKEKIRTAKYSTLKAYRKNAYKKLYSEGTALSESGEIISGIRKKNQLRIAAAKRGAETRRARMLKTPVLEPLTPEETDAEIQRQERQAVAEKDPETQEKVNEGKIVYESILELIDSFSHLGAGRTGEYVREVLDREINAYGFDKVMESIAGVPTEFIEDAQKLIFYSHDDSNLSTAYNTLVMLIEGAIPFHDQAREMEDILYSNTNFDTF